MPRCFSPAATVRRDDTPDALTSGRHDYHGRLCAPLDPPGCVRRRDTISSEGEPCTTVNIITYTLNSCFPYSALPLRRLSGSAQRNYPPPRQCKKLSQIRHMAERRNFESDGGSEPVRSVFGIRPVTFQKRRLKRLRASQRDWHLADNYFQRSSGSILA